MRLIDKQYLQTPFYGWPRMTAHLRRQGYQVKSKRIRRLMQFMGLQAIYTKPKTTISAKDHKVYSYYPLYAGVLDPNGDLNADLFQQCCGFAKPVHNGHRSPVSSRHRAFHLAIVVSIMPLRKRIQERLDRRFYCHKYNAEQVFASLSTTLREEVDLDHLVNALLEVVEETMKPAHISLWLREVDHQPRERQSEENS